MSNVIIAIVGMCGSGKSEFANFFERDGYPKLYFGGITLNEIKKRNLENNQENERLVREELRKMHGKDAYAKLLIPNITDLIQRSDIVLDGLYSWAEYKTLRTRFGEKLIILAIVANAAIRKQRLACRKIRSLSYAETANRDISEIEKLDKGGPIAIADFYVINNSERDVLFSQYHDFLQWLTIVRGEKCEI